MIKLGEKYKDKLTGIEGVAVAITEYQFGCKRIILEYIGKDEAGNKVGLEFTVDEQRLTAKKTKRPGGPGGPIPQKRSIPKRR